MLESDLDVIERLKPSQATFYPLMVPDASRKNMNKLMGKTSYQKESLFYKIISDRLFRDYKPNSAWCFSRSDSETIDEYIVKYDQYAGLGSGALGLIGDTIYSNTFSIKEYIESLSKGKLPLQSKKTFSAKELARYAFLMKLFGLNMDRAYFKKKFGHDIWRYLWLECLFFSFIRGIAIDKDKIRVTKSGMYYWVIMMREFFIGVDNFREINKSMIEEDPKNLILPL
jgi:coproporphyrinogen III oxidase-like Fe-S oxidoreductase